MNLATLAFRNLRRRQTRSVIVAISVGLAVASVLSLLALSDSAQTSAQAGVGERGADLTVAQQNASDIFSGFIPESVGPRIAKVAGVASVAGELASFVSVDHDRQWLAVGWSDDSFFWKTLPIAAGRAPDPGARRIAVLGPSAANALKKTVGDTVNILDAEFRVVAISGYSSALNRSLIIVPLADLQEVTFRNAQVTFFHLRLAAGSAPADVERIKQQIAGIGALEATPTDELLSHDRNLAVLNAISRATALIAISLGVLSVLNALLMAVQERTREIGVMMAIGWNKPRIMASIVIEGALLGLGGCVIGAILGYFVSFTFTSVPTIGTYLSFSPKATIVVPTLVVAVALCAIGSLYPAWRATLLNPAEAIRKV
jgi:putative ABC transport system permease protein